MLFSLLLRSILPIPKGPFIELAEHNAQVNGPLSMLLSLGVCSIFGVSKGPVIESTEDMAQVTGPLSMVFARGVQHFCRFPRDQLVS